MIRWVEHGRTVPRAAADVRLSSLLSLSFALHSLRDSEGTAQQPLSVRWHLQKVLTQPKGTEGGSAGTGGDSRQRQRGQWHLLLIPIPAWRDFVSSCPWEASSCTSAPDPVSGLPKLWLTSCWQLRLSDMSSFTFPF